MEEASPSDDHLWVIRAIRAVGLYTTDKISFLCPDWWHAFTGWPVNSCHQSVCPTEARGRRCHVSLTLSSLPHRATQARPTVGAHTYFFSSHCCLGTWTVITNLYRTLCNNNLLFLPPWRHRQTEPQWVDPGLDPVTDGNRHVNTHTQGFWLVLLYNSSLVLHETQKPSRRFSTLSSGQRLPHQGLSRKRLWAARSCTLLSTDSIFASPRCSWLRLAHSTVFPMLPGQKPWGPNSKQACTPAQKLRLCAPAPTSVLSRAPPVAL